MKRAHIDKQNRILGWYDSKIHKTIPEPNIEVSDEQWLVAISNGHNKVNLDGNTEQFDFRTPEEILADESKIQAENAAKARDEAMLAGFDYNGYQCSVTADDGNGMMQVETGFAKLKRGVELGLLPADTPIATVIKFRNGTELPMTDSEFEVFSILFTAERGKFFS